LGAILLIVPIPIPVGALPTWPHSTSRGQHPGGGIGLGLTNVVCS
jgi:hypothetical protein